jgi:hypothetical protein
MDHQNSKGNDYFSHQTCLRLPTGRQGRQGFPVRMARPGGHVTIENKL